MTPMAPTFSQQLAEHSGGALGYDVRSHELTYTDAMGMVYVARTTEQELRRLMQLRLLAAPASLPALGTPFEAGVRALLAWIEGPPSGGRAALGLVSKGTPQAEVDDVNVVFPDWERLRRGRTEPTALAR